MTEIALHLRIIIGILSFTLAGIIIELIRQGRLKEHYAIVWLLTAVCIFIFGIWPDSLNIVSRIVRLHHLTTLFMVAFLFLLAIVLHFSLAISQLFERNRRLTQEVAWLKFELEQLKEAKVRQRRVKLVQSPG
ncbi:MAG: DUF2304 domain-containing protein [Deltaproteobacteria bacterium]|nr:DUF2304 domain-containing protein [Deltaproteobacteria bacterium]MBW2071181.1 DUF2304 domain-containing protein [Deltaproteobacteria bacterium]